MTRFQAGELVDIAVTGARVVDFADPQLTVETDVDADLLTVDVNDAHVRVTRAVPAEGAPQPGDVWADRAGDRYFAQAWAGAVRLTPQVGGAGRDGDWRDMHRSAAGPLTLVWREGWSRKTPPAGRDREDRPTNATGETDPTAIATTGQPGDDRAAVITGLRELADFLEANPGVPVDSYSYKIATFVRHLPSVSGKDEQAQVAELVRIAGVLGVDPHLPSQPGTGHANATRAFAGGVEYRAVLATEASRQWYPVMTVTPTEASTGGGEAAAGPGGGAGPAAAPAGEVEHQEVRGWGGGGPGSCGVQCACGETYDGFDTLAEASGLLQGHIADVSAVTS